MKCEFTIKNAFLLIYHKSVKTFQGVSVFFLYTASDMNMKECDKKSIDTHIQV